MARASEHTTRQELQSLSQNHATVVMSATRSEREMSRLRSELNQLREVASVIDKSAGQFKGQLMNIVANELEALHQRLLDIVGESAKVERDNLVKYLLGGKTMGTWTFDSLPVRRRLADEVVAGFRRTETQLLALQQEIVPQLRRLLSALVPKAGSAIESAIVHRPALPPNLMSLGRYIALDLDESWWALLWRARPEPGQRGQELERLIRAEFKPIVDELMRACERSLCDHVVVTTDWSFGICNSIARSIAQRREQLLSHYERLQHEVAGATDPERLRKQQDLIAGLKERLDRCESLIQRLASIGRDIARDLPSAGG
jgi:hypothetical protein